MSVEKVKRSNMSVENRVLPSREVRQRRLRRSLCVALACAGSIALAPRLIQAPLTAESTAEAEVKSTVHEIVKAYNDNNYEKYFSMFADDITIFRGARGRWTKKEYHDGWKTVIEGGGGVASAGVEDLRVQMSPAEDSAVATYLMPVKSRFPGGVVPAGRKENIAYNMTEVWYRREGKWTLVHMYWTVQETPPGT
jgi:ketosteroid isomerase-like protein